MQVAPGLVGPAGLRTAHRDELAPPHEPPKTLRVVPYHIGWQSLCVTAA